MVAGLSDAQLLERFLTQGDAGAFEALVGRHGPMVLSVCRGIFRDPHDAEDAFQATFLVLVKKGGTIRGRDALGGWLHQVAHRVAIQANAAAARRRTHERQVGEMAVATSTNGPAAPDDLLPALHEEIARLPEKHRLAIVHLRPGRHDPGAGRRAIALERTDAPAPAGRGACPAQTPTGPTRAGTRRSRPWARCSCARRGPPSRPPREATVRAAVATVNPTMTVGVVSAAAQQLAQEVFKVMLLRKLAWASAILLTAGLIGWGASAALVRSGQEAPKADRAAAPARAGRPRSDRESRSRNRAPPTPDGTFPARGRVLDPDGKPVAGAGVYVRHYAEDQWRPIDPMAARQKGRVRVDGCGRPVPFRAGQGFERCLRSRASRLAQGPDRGRRAGIRTGLGRGRRPGQAGRGRRCDWSATMCPSAGVSWIRKAGPSPGWSYGSERSGRSRTGSTSTPCWPQAPLMKTCLRSRELRGPARLGGPDLATGYRDALAGGPEHLDHRRRRSIRGPGNRPRPHRPAGVPRRRRGGRHDRRDGPRREGPLKARPQSGLRLKMGLDRPQGAFLLLPPGDAARRLDLRLHRWPAKPITGVVRLEGLRQAGRRRDRPGRRPGDAYLRPARTDAAGRFRLDGLPRSEFYQISADPRQGIDPFLRHSEIIEDTAGTNPIETAIEVPPGVVVTGRLIDKATGRTIPAAEAEYNKAPGKPGRSGKRWGSTDWPTRRSG